MVKQLGSEGRDTVRQLPAPDTPAYCVYCQTPDTGSGGFTEPPWIEILPCSWRLGSIAATLSRI